MADKDSGAAAIDFQPLGEALQWQFTGLHAATGLHPGEMILFASQCYDAEVIESGNHHYGNRASEPIYRNFS